MHSYNLGDEVYHPCDTAPFKVVGIREEEIEIEGDWSGGTAPYPNYKAKGWVQPQEVKPYDKSKVTYYINGKPFKNGQPVVR